MQGSGDGTERQPICRKSIWKVFWSVLLGYLLKKLPGEGEKSFPGERNSVRKGKGAWSSINVCTNQKKIHRYLQWGGRVGWIGMYKQVLRRPSLYLLTVHLHLHVHPHLCLFSHLHLHLLPHLRLQLCIYISISLNIHICVYFYFYVPKYSCLENPMDGGAWWAAVHGVAKSQTWLSDFTFTFHLHALEKEMATHSSVLAWRIPGTGEPGGLPSMGSRRVGHNWNFLKAITFVYNNVSLIVECWPIFMYT